MSNLAKYVMPKYLMSFQLKIILVEHVRRVLTCHQ
jgi:hypothetical protein